MSSFDQLKKEFAGMDSEERTYLGLIGLQNISKQITMPVKDKPDTVNYMDDFKYREDDVFADAEVMVHEKSLSSLVDKMKESVFRVKLVDTFKDLILPLQEELQKNQLEDHLFHLKNHEDATWYRRNTIEAIHDMSDKLGTSLTRGLLLEFRRFSRNPVWGTLRLLTTNLVLPVMNMVSSVLLGWRKKSDTDRIVDAIKELTTLTRTGQVFQEKTLFDRVATSGVIGALGRSVTQGFLKDMGITRQRAQNVEETGGALRSRTDLNIGDRIAAAFFSDEITKKTQGAVKTGRNQSSEFYEQNINYLSKIDDNVETYLSMVVDELRKSLSFQQSDVIDLSTSQYQRLGLIDDTVKLLAKQTSEHNSLMSTMVESLYVNSLQMQNGYNTATGTDSAVGTINHDKRNRNKHADGHSGKFIGQYGEQNTQQLAEVQKEMFTLGFDLHNQYAKPSNDPIVQNTKNNDADNPTTVNFGKEAHDIQTKVIDLMEVQLEQLEGISSSTKETAREAKRARRREMMRGMFGGIKGALFGAGASLMGALSGFGGILAAIAKRFSIIAGAIGVISGTWKAFKSFEESDDMLMRTLKVVKGASGGLIEGVADATIGLITKGVDYFFDTNTNEVYQSVVAKTKMFFQDPIANLMTGLDKLDNAMYKGFDWVVDNTIGTVQRTFRIRIEQFKNMVHGLLPDSVAKRIVGERPTATFNHNQEIRNQAAMSFANRMSTSREPEARRGMVDQDSLIGGLASRVLPQRAANMVTGDQQRLNAGNFAEGFQQRNQTTDFDFINSHDEGVSLQLNMVEDVLRDTQEKASEFAEKEIVLLTSIRDFIKQVANKRPDESTPNVFSGSFDDMQLIRDIGR